MDTYKFIPVAGAAALVFVLLKVAPIVLRFSFSPLRHVPGPKSSSWLFGNLKEILHAENSVMHEQWIEKYGSTLKYTGMFNTCRLLTLDPRALQHILTHYEKPAQARFGLSRILGEGLLVVEGEEHRNQRRIMNPAFGPIPIREMTDIFIDKATQLRDIWMAEIDSRSDNQAKFDVLSWLSKLTLDVIGLAGFNYKFDALNTDEKPNELNQAFSTIFQSGTQFNILLFLQGFIPMLRFIPTENSKNIRQAQQTMDRIGKQLLEEKKAGVLKSNSGAVEKDTFQGRDLLSLLVRANMSTDLPESQRLSDKDVLAQVPTFLVAGHETTSTSTTWCLYALCLRLDVQSKLRDELLTVPTDNPTMDQLLALPYLDAVVRETLRVHAPVPSTIRVPTKDDIIPLSIPFVDRKGRTQNSIRVSKGDNVFIPILAMNRSKNIWGEDAHEFKPERWESIPEAVTTIPGVWGNMLTFLAGPHACIGYRFSLVEMKAILFVLLRSFEFELAVPAKDISKKSMIVQRPVVLSEPEKKNQMPLFVRPFRR